MSSTFCPNCGTPRVGSFRYCRTCQFDFDSTRDGPDSTRDSRVSPTVNPNSPPKGAAAWLTTEPLPPPPVRMAGPIAPTPQRRRAGWDSGARFDVVAIVIVFAAVGIAVPVGMAMMSGAPLFGSGTISRPASPAPEPASSPSATPTPRPTPQPTPDEKRPTITGRTPGRNTVGAATSTTIRIVFSEPVRNVSAVTVHLVNVRGGWSVRATVRYDAAKRTATLAPNLRMYPNTQYLVAILPGITDLARNRLAATSWTFRTGSR